VRHEYDIATQHLVVEENRDFILITLDWPAERSCGFDGKTKKDQINRLAGLILKLNGTHGWRTYRMFPTIGFHLPPTIGRGYEILNRLRAGSIPNVVLGPAG